MAEHKIENSGNPPGWDKEFQWGLTVEFGVTVWSSPAVGDDPAMLYGDICNHEGLILYTHAVELSVGAFDDLAVEQQRQATIDGFLEAIYEVNLEGWE